MKQKNLFLVAAKRYFWMAICLALVTVQKLIRRGRVRHKTPGPPER
jgi:predicted metal-binding membrane protein